MTEADILAALVTYLEGKADGEVVGYPWLAGHCPVARALSPSLYPCVSPSRVRFWTVGHLTVLVPLTEGGELQRFILRIDALGSDGITAATARRLLSEVRG